MHEATGSLSTAISNAMVALHLRQFGRGPAETRTIIDGEIIVCVMRGVLTQSEHTLVEGGAEGAVSNSRSMLQEASRREFMSIIEGESGGTVRSFISSISVVDDVAVETFLLADDVFPVAA
jgi:uncharacterized protein YbcI